MKSQLFENLPPIFSRLLGPKGSTLSTIVIETSPRFMTGDLNINLFDNGKYDFLKSYFNGRNSVSSTVKNYFKKSSPRVTLTNQFFFS